MDKAKIFIVFLLTLLITYGIYYHYQRAQWAKFYRQVQYTYWGKTSFYGEVIELEWYIEKPLTIMGNVVIYPDQFSGNTYVINAKGDTIFKYIKNKER